MTIHTITRAAANAWSNAPGAAAGGLSAGLLLGLAVGCQSHPRTTPPLEKRAPETRPVVSAQTQRKGNWFSRTGDATLNVIQQPVKWVMPAKKPALATAPADSGPAEPADAIIMSRNCQPEEAAPPLPGAAPEAPATGPSDTAPRQP